MSNYKMNIYGQIGLSDYSYIHDYMAIVEPDDNFQIQLTNVNDDEAEVVCSILSNDKFDIVDKTVYPSGECCIKVAKRY